MKETREIKSYVFHNPSGRCFFISTIERDTSASCPPPLPRFMETIIRDVDWETKNLGDLIEIVNANHGIEKHFEVCRQLHATGEYKEPENE